MTWQDIDNIVRLFEEIEHEDNVCASDWCMDENNTGISSSAISACCLGKRKSIGGYTWKYLHDIK